jgi:transposase InsO family protein
MYVHERGVPAAPYLAAVPIAQQRRATDGRRNRLRSALRVRPGRRLALAREWTAHVGSAIAIAIAVAVAVAVAVDAGCLILHRALATRMRLRVDARDLLGIAACHFPKKSRKQRNDWARWHDNQGQSEAPRGTKPGLQHHSDRGGQYTSQDYRAKLTELGIEVSMSCKGNCWDNAVGASSRRSKTELVYGRSWNSRSEVRNAVFEYIEIFYNCQRLHSTPSEEPTRARPTPPPC